MGVSNWTVVLLYHFCRRSDASIEYRVYLQVRLIVIRNVVVLGRSASESA
jgi:hypothetical protein